MIPGLRDHYTNNALTEYFLKKEGNEILLPTRHLPDQALLEKHRENMAG